MYRIGIISDSHNRPETISGLVHMLDQYVQAFVLNGDVGETEEHIFHTLGTVASTGKPTYVIPGSHEEVVPYLDAVEALSRQYPNLINCLDVQKHVVQGQHLIFLPGSDWNAGGQFHLQDDIPQGIHLQSSNSLVALPQAALAAYGKSPMMKHLVKAHTSISELDRLVTQPERSTVFCHVPAKYHSATSVDRAYFAQSSDGSVMPGVQLEAEVLKIHPHASYEQIQEHAKRYGYTLREENRGNAELLAAYARTGVSKVISGHIHESAHHATTNHTAPVGEGEPTTSLALMASYADAGLASVITIHDNLISYHKIQLPGIDWQRPLGRVVNSFAPQEYEDLRAYVRSQVH